MSVRLGVRRPAPWTSAQRGRSEMRLLPAPRQVIRQFRTRPIRVARSGFGNDRRHDRAVHHRRDARPRLPSAQVLGADRADAIAGQYIVVLKNGAMDRAGVGRLASALASRHSGRVGYVYSAALRGFSVSMSAAAAARLAADPDVAYVEQDGMVSIDATQHPTPSWGLDRIDQRDLPLNNSYTYPNTAPNVHAYIIDTGIRSPTPTSAAAPRAASTPSTAATADDCHGHGTHVAGTVGGSAYGVAKGVPLVARPGAQLRGSGTNARVIAGIDWVTGERRSSRPWRT